MRGKVIAFWAFGFAVVVSTTRAFAVGVKDIPAMPTLYTFPMIVAFGLIVAMGAIDF
jgi:hypothetical protein